MDVFVVSWQVTGMIRIRTKVSATVKRLEKKESGRLADAQAVFKLTFQGH